MVEQILITKVNESKYEKEKKHRLRCTLSPKQGSLVLVKPLAKIRVGFSRRLVKQCEIRVILNRPERLS